MGIHRFLKAIGAYSTLTDDDIREYEEMPKRPPVPAAAAIAPLLSAETKREIEKTIDRSKASALLHELRPEDWPLGELISFQLPGTLTTNGKPIQISVNSGAVAEGMTIEELVVAAANEIRNVLQEQRNMAGNDDEKKRTGARLPA